MLVYVNQFELIDPQGDEIFSLLAEWLSEKTKQQIDIPFLKSGQDLITKDFSLRTYSAGNFTPSSYAVSFSHPDKRIPNRQWAVEVGIELNQEITNVSISLEQKDLYVINDKEPIFATKPHLVALINRSPCLSNRTVGRAIKVLRDNPDDIAYLGYEIDMTEREHFVFLMRSDGNGNFSVDPKKLQHELIGLAQIYVIDESIDFEELAYEIGEDNLVEKGEIRVFYPPMYQQHDRTLDEAFIDKLKGKLKQKEANGGIYRQFLLWMTAYSNIHRKEKHLPPKVIKSRRNRQEIACLKDQLLNNKSNEDYEQLKAYTAAFEKEFDQNERELAKYKEKNAELEMALRLANEKLAQLPEQGQHFAMSYNTEYYPGEMREFLLGCIQHYENDRFNVLTPRDIQIIEALRTLNKYEGKGEQMFVEFDKVFSTYRGIAVKKSGFTSMANRYGFIIQETKENATMHHKSHPAHKMFFAKTPSDHHAGKNIAREIRAQFAHAFVKKTSKS